MLARRHQLRALRYQRIVGGELVGELRLSAFFDEQHFLDLEQHRLEGLEIEGAYRPDLDPAQLLHRQQRLAALCALTAEGARVDDILRGDAAKRGGHVWISLQQEEGGRIR